MQWASTSTSSGYLNSKSSCPKTHKRNLSLDISTKIQTKCGIDNKHSELTVPIGQLEKMGLKKRHTRHNSYENERIQLSKPVCVNIDQTANLSERIINNTTPTNESDSYSSMGTIDSSPVYSKSTFSDKKISDNVSSSNIYKWSKNSKTSVCVSSRKQEHDSYRHLENESSVRESSQNESYHINDKDNLHTTSSDLLSSPDSDDMNAKSNRTGRILDANNQINSSGKPITNTRYNKAFIMRMEQNKQITTVNHGTIACPNTPELTRRSTKTRSSFRDSTSMPRDSSLSRLKTELQNFQTSKKTLKQPLSKPIVNNNLTDPIKQRVLPKYMDISKYKPAQGQSFLKRDESKSTLVSRSEMKKSPSAVGLSRNDTTRSSTRVKSAGAKPNTPTGSKGRCFESISSFLFYVSICIYF